MNPFRANWIAGLLIAMMLATSVVGSAAARSQSRKSHGKFPAKGNPRIAAMSAADRELFQGLTEEQKNNLKEGRIVEGYNEWMVTMALGKPFYKSEHHPTHKNYEQIWLYTKKIDDKKIKEDRIIDPQTRWPSVQRITKVKTCTVGDFFVLFDRSVVVKTVPDDSNKVYGTCLVSTTEEVLPIVKGKVIENKK
jgi:hypothetical protein